MSGRRLAIVLVLFCVSTLFEAVPLPAASPLASGTPAIAVQPPTTASEPLLCLQELIPDMVPDVRYATTNNFTGKQVYDSDRLWLLPEAARSLQRAAAYLKTRYGLRFKVFDAYRPLAVQKKFWEILPNPDYVADPKIGSKHNRGAAVDLTLVIGDGTELEMGTGFDDFTPRAGWAAKDLSVNARKNRQILRQVMERFGFKALPSEWWHYDFTALERSPILDIPIN